MINQVNNIIFNLIVSGRGVWLPDIAALRVVRHSAQQGASSHTVMSPRLAVEFTSHREGVSLVDEIARAASVDVSAARDIYDRWIDKTLSDGVLTIEGIGVLRGKSFVADEALIALLNADTGGAVRIVKRRGSGRRRFVAVAVFVLAAVAGAIIYMYGRGDKQSVGSETTVVAESQSPISAADDTIVDREDMPGVADADDVAADVTEVAAESTVAEAVDDAREQTQGKPETTVAQADIRYRVIIGSYSTRENAERAVAEAGQRVSGLQFEIRPLGRLFAVAAFGAPTRGECEAFIREHRNVFPQAWINPVKR